MLEARPAESEIALTFCALGDLLHPVLDDALAPLPEGQKRALSRALVLGDDDGPPPDPHAVGIAVLNALRGLAEQRPMLLAIDDVQWLDPASAGRSRSRCGGCAASGSASCSRGGRRRERAPRRGRALPAADAVR